MAQRPVVVGLHLCEQVVIEEKTRNVTLVNSFTRRTVERLPGAPFPFVLFAVLTDGAGDVLQRLDSLDVIFRQDLTARFTDPLQEVRCVFRIRQCSFPVAGHYQAALLADGELLGQRRFRVEESS